MTELRKALYKYRVSSKRIHSYTNLNEMTYANPVYFDVLPKPYVYELTNEDKDYLFSKTGYLSDSVPGKIELPPIRLSILRDCFLCPSTGHIYNHDGRMMIESSLTRNHTSLSALPNKIIRRKSNDIEGICSTINLEYWKYYGHWLVHCLTRVYALSKIEVEIKLIVPSSISRTYRKLLEWILTPNIQLVTVDESKPILKLDCLSFSPIAMNNGVIFFRPEVLNFMRDSVIFNINNSTISPSYNRPPERIYLSRKNQVKRRVRNEEKLLKLLDNYNIVPIIPEDLSIEEQVSLFNNAKLIVAPIGSAYLNSLFSSMASIVIINPYKERLINHLNQWGFCVSCKHKLYQVFHNFEDSNVLEYDVDIDRVVDAVKIAIDNMNCKI